MTLLGFTNWHDEKYTRIEDDAEWEIARAVTVQHMKTHDLRFTGDYHQNGERGAPYFDTGKKLCMSMRAWGSLMTEVMDIPKEEANGRDMSYCEWAWVANEGEEVLPDE